MCSEPYIAVVCPHLPPWPHPFSSPPRPDQHHHRANHPRYLSSCHNTSQGFCSDNSYALAPVLDALAVTPIGDQTPPRPSPLRQPKQKKSSPSTKDKKNNNVVVVMERIPTVNQKIVFSVPLQWLALTVDCIVVSVPTAHC